MGVVGEGGIYMNVCGLGDGWVCGGGGRRGGWEGGGEEGWTSYVRKEEHPPQYTRPHTSYTAPHIIQNSPTTQAPTMQHRTRRGEIDSCGSLYVL